MDIYKGVVRMLSFYGKALIVVIIGVPLSFLTILVLSMGLMQWSNDELPLKYTVPLGNGYAYGEDEAKPVGCIIRNNQVIVSSNVFCVYYDSTFIIACRTPENLHQRNDGALIENQQQFLLQYWIINKELYKEYGPYSLNQFDSVRSMLDININVESCIEDSLRSWSIVKYR